jgi:hypothetical protein
MAHGEAILTYEALLALKGRLEPQVLKDHKVILARQARRALLVQRVMMELPDRKARQVLQAHRVRQALQVLQVPRVLLDLHPLMLGQDTV